ncbi:MAG: hypothetical protein ABIR47_11570, partial [Candidatus Kapaibacterium sp.]
MRRILDKLSTSPLMAALLDSVKNRRETNVTALAGSLRSLVTALIHQRTGEPVLMVFEEKEEADSVFADLVTLIGSDHALLYQEEHHTAATIRDSLDA